MPSVTLRRFGAIAIVVSCNIAIAQALAQGNGDYDFDSDVDGDDFLQWGDCMTLPGGVYVDEWSPCAAFDFDGDSDVDLHDLGAFQGAFQKQPALNCGPAQKRYNIGALVEQGSIGVTAWISAPHNDMKLCGEGTSTALALSNVHIGVSLVVGGVAQQWAQMGYGRRRIQGHNNIQEGIFAETMAKRLPRNQAQQQPQFYNFAMDNISIPPWVHPLEGGLGNTGIPIGNRHYRCYKSNPSLDEWRYILDGLFLHSWDNPELANMVGNTINLSGELKNRLDDLVGVAGGPCELWSFEYKKTTSPHSWPALNIDSSQLHPIPQPLQGEWDSQVTSGVLQIWDKNINQ